MKISIFSTLAVLYAATSVVAAPSATVVDTDSDVDLDYNNLGVTFNEADGKYRHVHPTHPDSSLPVQPLFRDWNAF